LAQSLAGNITARRALTRVNNFQKIRMRYDSESHQYKNSFVKFNFAAFATNTVAKFKVPPIAINSMKH
jgi:hypothetical protein